MTVYLNLSKGNYDPDFVQVLVNVTPVQWVQEMKILGVG